MQMHNPLTDTVRNAQGWFVYSPLGATLGPYSSETLAQKVASGTLAPTSYIAIAGDPGWRQLGDVPEVAEAVRRSSSPPATPAKLAVVSIPTAPTVPKIAAPAPAATAPAPATAAPVAAAVAPPVTAAAAKPAVTATPTAAAAKPAAAAPVKVDLGMIAGVAATKFPAVMLGATSGFALIETILVLALRK
jgi:hypothetical protein